MPETRKVFHEELDQLHADAVRLAALASESIQAGTACLLDFDLAQAKAVIAGDKVLDDLTHSIEERTYLLLARQQPMAVDLRMLVTTLRIIHELERIGDLMVNVAKGARRLYPGPLDPKVRGIIDRMRSQATAQLQLASDTFADRDPAKASALADMDDVMDDLQKDLFRAIFAGFSAEQIDEAHLQMAVQLAFVGRDYERTADHAVMIGHWVAFMITGKLPGDPETSN
jgi:phosphate transport system protein